MKYTVVWKPAAERHLMEIWMRADDRDAVARAADALDAALARNAEQQGESREEGVRVTFVSPLGINFEVNAPDRHVRVLAVWRTDRR
jgi:plasmid stabilization system protein ParE